MLAKLKVCPSVFEPYFVCISLPFVYSTVNISRRIQIKFLAGVLTDEFSKRKTSVIYMVLRCTALVTFMNTW